MPKKTIGTSAVAIGSGTVNKLVTVLADDDNTNPIWIGYANTVTAGTDDTLDGMKLSPGKSYTIPVEKLNRQSPNLSNIFGISDAADQLLYIDTL